ESVDLQGKDQIHGEFDGLTGSVWAKMKNLFAHHGENGVGVFQSGRVAAGHEKQFTFFGAPVAAGDWGIEEARAAFGAGRGDFAGEGGRDGAGVNVNAAALEGLHGAGWAPENFFESGRIADHGEKKVGSGDDFLRGFCELG